MTRLRVALLGLLCLGLGACASVEPYPGTTPGRTAEEKAALYQTFALQRDAQGDYHAQGHDYSAPMPVLRYQAQTAPEFIPHEPGQKFMHWEWEDLGWLGAWAGAFFWSLQLDQSAPQLGLSETVEFGAMSSLLTHYLGRFEQGVDQQTQRWDRALAKDLDQPEPAWPVRETRYVDTLPGFKWGLGVPTTYRSGLDYQDEFTPPNGIFYGRYQDTWTRGVYLSLGYGFKNAWTLDADLDLEHGPGAWAYRGSTGTYLVLSQNFALQDLRIGRAWDWRFDGPLDLSLMPFVGWGLGEMGAEMTEKDSAGARLGHYRLSAAGMTPSAGLRLAWSQSKHVASTLELGYRWLHLDNARIDDADGSFAGRTSPELTQRDSTAYWDLSGPYLKVGFLFL